MAVTKKIPAISVVVAGGNIDKIIPMYIEKMFPRLVRDHVSLGNVRGCHVHAERAVSCWRHVLWQGFLREIPSGGKGDTLMVTRVGVGLTIILTVVWGLILPESIVALATAFFFGLCSSSFLPVFIMGIYWRGVTKTGALASMVSGFTISSLYALFIHQKEAVAIGLCKKLFGVDTLVSSYAPMSTMWKLQFVDQNVIALPLSFLILIIVSLSTAKMDEKHLNRCWKNF